MKNTIQVSPAALKLAKIKALVLVVLLLGALYVVRLTQASAYLTAEALASLLDMAGFWAPFVFMMIYALGVCLFVPGLILTGLGAGIFGVYWGFIYVWAGAMAGASASFFMGRKLGRDFAASLAGERFQKYNDAIERNGFSTVLYLRLIYLPFTPTNVGMGLTKVRFWDYFFGTALGIVGGTFVFTFLAGTLKEIWISGNWADLASFRVFFSVSLLFFSLLIPKIVKRIRNEE